MEHFEAIRLQALREVVNARRLKPREGDPDYPIRKVLREYSVLFSTPLHEAEELPIEYVLQHFFEYRFDQLSEQELNDVVADVLEPPEVLRRAQLQEDRDDYESVLDIRRIADEEAVKRTKGLDVKAGRQEADIRQGPSREADLVPKKLIVIPEGISMTFATDEDDSIGFGLFDGPGKK